VWFVILRVGASALPPDQRVKVAAEGNPQPRPQPRADRGSCPPARLRLGRLNLSDRALAALVAAWIVTVTATTLLVIALRRLDLERPRLFSCTASRFKFGALIGQSSERPGGAVTAISGRADG